MAGPRELAAEEAMKLRRTHVQLKLPAMPTFSATRSRVRWIRREADSTIRAQYL